MIVQASVWKKPSKRNTFFKGILAFAPMAGVVTHTSLSQAMIVGKQIPKSMGTFNGKFSELNLEMRSEITSEEQRFVFNKPIYCTISAEDGVWSYECAELEIYSYGLTEDDSRKDFEEDFVSAWNEIALEDDDNLTVDAQMFKKQLKSLVKRVASNA